LFLASEVMLFGALFSAYILLRVGADPGTWPHGLLNIPIGTFNTAVLITSSVTVVLSWAALKMNQFDRFKKFQAITLLCALGFLMINHSNTARIRPLRSLAHRRPAHDGISKVIPGSGPKKRCKRKSWSGSVSKPTPITMPNARRSAGDSTAAAKPAHGAHGPKLELELANIRRLSAFVPAHSTYFAIYFTLTALHALHVLGGRW